MNIGLDIDNVITAFDSAILAGFLKEDQNKRGKGIVNPKAEYLVKMFDWSQDEIDKFFADNMESIAQKLKVKKDCKKYMDKLLEDGHKLYLISHRAYPHYKNPEQITLDWLSQHKINYTKLVLSKNPDKTRECKLYNIDIMVDDRVDQCKKMISSGINCILMMTKYNKNRMEGLPFAKNWQDLYEEISQWKKGM